MLATIILLNYIIILATTHILFSFKMISYDGSLFYHHVGKYVFWQSITNVTGHSLNVSIRYKTSIPKYIAILL